MKNKNFWKITNFYSTNLGKVVEILIFLKLNHPAEMSSLLERGNADEKKPSIQRVLYYERKKTACRETLKKLIKSRHFAVKY